MEQIQTGAKIDPELGPLLEKIVYEWPDSSIHLQKDLKKYWSLRDHLSIGDGPILKCGAIMIPKSMREEIFIKNT